jgi:glycerol-3-phosphate acyltransferase PlsY
VRSYDDSVSDAAALVAVIASYGVGQFPTAQLVGRSLGVDPTRAGSGNPGASNVTRVAGWRAGLVVLLGDLAKGLAPTLLALVILGRGAALGCWLAATLGHVFPLARRFRGGKGVATAGGGALVLLPVVSVVLIALFVIIVAIRRTPSLGSLTMATGLPIGAALAGRPGREIVVAALVGGLVVVRHAENIRRLVRREEQPVTGR